jgi:hypothetical protein
MTNKMNIAAAFVVLVLLTSSGVSQPHDSKLGDDYARAALRAVIYTNQNGISAERIAILLDEADVEASTPAEEASLKELNRVLALWMNRPLYDRQPCYLALKANLKARNGATPEACRKNCRLQSSDSLTLDCRFPVCDSSRIAAYPPTQPCELKEYPCVCSELSP